VELIDIELSEFTRRSRSVVLAHRAAGLERGLEYGERVLLHTGDEYRTAVVADIDFELEDTRYRLILGGRVPAEIARERAGANVSTISGRVSVHDVADMLARSGAGHRIPMQRRSAQRLLFDR
jgi:outer membrane biogenesis lipoprotein LolB